MCIDIEWDDYDEAMDARFSDYNLDEGKYYAIAYSWDISEGIFDDVALVKDGRFDHDCSHVIGWISSQSFENKKDAEEWLSKNNFI